MGKKLASLLNREIKQEIYKSVDKLPDWLTQEHDYSTQIRSLRLFLGMTQEQLASRASQNSRLIRRLESGTVDPRLSTLKKTAEGLECELIVRFVPKKPLIALLRQKAEQKAKEIVRLSKGTAAMENQEPQNKYIKHQIEELIEELINKKLSLLWEK